MLKVAARTIAWAGRAPRVATRVAIALAASWNPLVSAKTTEKAIAKPSSIRAIFAFGPGGRARRASEQR
jgi:hypothetical protein